MPSPGLQGDGAKVWQRFTLTEKLARFSIYFAMTGLHAFHMIVGLILMAWIYKRAAAGHFTPTRYVAIETAGPQQWPLREGDAGSHAGHGWEKFTDAIISVLGSQQSHVVFVLWGSHAQKKSGLIQPQHTILTSAHPSPLSAHRGFLGSRPFSQINQALTAHSQQAIDWRIPL